MIRAARLPDLATISQIYTSQGIATTASYDYEPLDGAASQNFHAALGFELMGVLPEGGFKFGRWLDVAFWVKRLGA